MATRIIERARRRPPYDGAVYDDPDTPEDYLTRYGIRSESDLIAAVARPAKSSVLIEAIIDFTLSVAFFSYEQSARLLTGLLDEQELRSADLANMTRALTGHRHAGDGLLLAICSHDLVDVNTTTCALWNAGAAVTADVAIATRSLTAAAVGWVRRTYIGGGGLVGGGYANASTKADITDVVDRWSAATADNPTQAVFILHNWTNFAELDEGDDMLAAGRAVCADPAGP